MDEYSLVVKENSLIQASYNLTLIEQRLLLLAIIVIREHTHNNELDYIAFSKPIKIFADSYIKQFDVSRQTAYQGLKEACKTLFARQFSYQERRQKGIANITSRWVSDIGYIDSEAYVELTFSRSVIPLITELESSLTSYEIGQVSNLTSAYALRLYELLVAWKNKGVSPKWQLEDFRNKMGVEEGKYLRMGQFKERVLDFAVEQINQYTDITVKYQQYKKGRKVEAFKFIIKIDPREKDITPSRNSPNNDMFTVEGLNNNQLGRIARNPSFVADYNHMVSSTSPAGQDPKAWEFEMINRLRKDASQFKKRPIREYLEY